MKLFVLLILSILFMSCNQNQNDYRGKMIEKYIESEEHYLTLREIDKIQIDDSSYNIEVLNFDLAQLNMSLFKYTNENNDIKLIRYKKYYSELLKSRFVVIEYSYKSYSYYLKLKRFPNKKYKGFSIRWKNIACEDKFNFPNDESWNYNWDIGKFTDTLFTNLPKYVIKKCFISFDGIYVKDTIKQILFLNQQIKHENLDSLKFFIDFK